MRSIVVALAALAAAFVTGCPPPDEDDRTPPRVLSVEPAAPVVPVTTQFRVIFSEELNDKTVSGDVTADNLSVVLVARDKVNDTFLSDIDNPPLSESRQDDVVPLVVALVDGRSTISVQPRADLTPGTAFSLLISSEVRDGAGNPLVDAAGNKNAFVYEFQTDAGPPAVAATDIGAAGIVVPNRKLITVTFNQPVVGVGNDSLVIEGSPAPNIDAILLNETRTEATVVLAPLGAGCETLGANADYTLVAKTSIASDVGQALESEYREAFSASGSCDLVANTVTGAVTAVASDVNATIRFTTTKPSTTAARFGAGGDLDCDGIAPCPVLGPPTIAANALHSVVISGLTVNVDYEVVVTAVDQTGSVATARATFRTAPLPKVAVNEAMQDADNTRFTSDAQGEYVELASFEPADPISLVDWSLRVTKVSGGTPSDCALGATAPTILPGEFLVLADSTFDETKYPGLDPGRVFEFAAFCALNNEAIVIELVDPAGRPVSSMTTGAPDQGVSFERTDPAATDVPANVCQSRADTGATPGRENGVKQRGCE